MRELTANVQTATTAPLTAPRYLIELGFTVVQRHSTREQLNWNGLTWIQTGAMVDRYEEKAAVVSLANADLAAGAIVLGEGVKGKAITIWALYGDAPHAVDDAVELFTGFMDTYSFQGMRVQITCTRQSISTSHSPRHVIAPPICNHLVVPGTRIGNTVLESR